MKEEGYEKLTLPKLHKLLEEERHKTATGRLELVRQAMFSGLISPIEANQLLDLPEVPRPDLKGNQ